MEDPKTANPEDIKRKLERKGKMYIFYVQGEITLSKNVETIDEGKAWVGFVRTHLLSPNAHWWFDEER